MKFNFYNKPTRIIMLFVMVPIFSFLMFLFLGFQDTFMYLLALFFLMLILIFVYKNCFIKIYIDDNKIHYKSLFREKIILKKDLKDVLIMSKKRRSEPEFIDFEIWYEKEIQGGNDFILFRTEQKMPKSTSFVFSDPMDTFYISVQYREELENYILELIDKNE